VILVDQPAESIDADDYTVSPTPGGSRLRRLKRQSAVRSFFVIVPQILSEDPLQMALPEDQEVVQALPPHRLYEALGKGVGLRGADRGTDDAHALGPKHLIERARELGVAIADEEADRRLARIQLEATQAERGWAETPAMCTLLVDSSMKNST
jgi:hypothetical protein